MIIFSKFHFTLQIFPEPFHRIRERLFFSFLYLRVTKITADSESMHTACEVSPFVILSFCLPTTENIVPDLLTLDRVLFVHLSERSPKYSCVG